MKKILCLLLCSLFLFTVTGCGDKNSKKGYSEAIVAVRDYKTDRGNKYGDLFDKALENSKWTEKDDTVTVKGKDKESGKTIEIIWKVTKNDSGEYKIKPTKFLRDGETSLLLALTEYIGDLDRK